MTGRLWVFLSCSVALPALAGVPNPVHAQSLSEVAGQIEALQQELREQRSLIESQADRITQQQQEIDRLRQQVVAANDLDQQRAAGLPPSVQAFTGLQAAATLPNAPVGQAPELPKVEAQVQAVPEGQGVLTRPGHFVFEPSIEYTNSAENRLVFRGIELVPGLQLGVIEASEADRNTTVATAALRFGLARNIEIEARVPYLLRSDRVSFVQQRDAQISRGTSLSAHNIGDAEFSVRYQINRPIGPHPIFIASLRVKSNTGKSPFEIPFDEFGVATGLATGSGFWAVQPGVNFLLPSDPVVIYGGVSYLYHMAKTIGRTIAVVGTDGSSSSVTIGRVNPGDAIGGNIGFGFALNPRFSFSLGYKHTYVFPTSTELGGTIQRSTRLQVGSLSLGMSYRLSTRQTLNLGIDIGATADAPDLSVNLRMPFQIN
jgi:uncharacterized protein YbjT (DUF2867 family)